jgi:hypothetical protein
MKGKVIALSVFIALGLIFISGIWVSDSPDAIEAVVVSTDVSSVATNIEVVNYQTYNIDYMNDDVKAILVKQLGTSGKTAFYLPKTGYINVSRGTKYGVAFAIKNVDPKIPEGNEFAYNFDIDPSSVGDCRVSASEAQLWIERGWKSSGIIGGQWREDWNEWYDAMTIYFSFPEDIEACSIRYDFVILKDGVLYDSRSLDFNLV